jgi:hypothetical protein
MSRPLYDSVEPLQPFCLPSHPGPISLRAIELLEARSIDSWPVPTSFDDLCVSERSPQFCVAHEPETTREKVRPTR